MHDPCPGRIDPSDDCCAYCGSLNPETFMARLEKGDVTLCPTNKNYKVYITNAGGEDFKQTYGEIDPETSEATGKLVTRPIRETKFYFVHLTEEQMQRFVVLSNEGKLRLQYPGLFYKKPFFMRARTPEDT